MPKIKKHDFVEIEYTGKIKETNEVFDTTDEKIAKDNNVYEKSMKYGPVTICVGEGQVIPALDKELEGKETGKQYKIELPPEKAFGKKNAKLIQLVSTSKFLSQNIAPQPGLQVNIDGVLGIVKHVSGGRTLVDFNHPLSGRDIIYDLKINKLIRDDKTKLDSYLGLSLNKKIDCEIKEGIAKVKLDIPKDIQEKLKSKIKDVIPSIKKLEFAIQEEQKK